MNKFLKFYIGGQWVDPVEPRTHVVINPATEEPAAEISMGTAADVDRAVRAAREAFPSYSKVSTVEKLQFFKRVLEILKRRQGEIASTISLEMGCPITFANEAQVPMCVSHVEAIIDVLGNFEFEEKVGKTLVVREPIGVVGLITPWNWPLNQIVCKVLYALAAGCTIVLKPSEVAPLDATIFAEILEEAGLPAGVFNLVNGDGATVGEAISRHPDIDMVSFTGSTRAGVLIAKAAADTVKRVTQELGGKSANIILDDVDLESAIRSGVAWCFANSGQSCDAPTRMFVSRKQYEAAISIAADEASKHVLGDPSDPKTVLGPVANRTQYEKIQRIIASGVTEGARLVTGGPGRPQGLDRGFYIKPTIFADVTPDMEIAREEIFGPVLTILPYDSEEEAIELANATEYGLAGFVSAKDIDRARDVARKLRVGTVFMNSPDFDVRAPFGGYKRSGNGREGGVHGLAEYLEIKAIIGHG
ncbi:aldehyde dehydrogenase family protein [Paraburkholderia caribensis]|uniref:Aldehyde dehydrogenase n=1 Tax=Paraburkholderia caribensis TaxID=75105 RepID=A0A9Q6S7S0_9BURK|nr:aldehyde dehydrogenase family protein [Paraburkholderia caribensis]MCO4878254.1 aldehyde dehydrogenase family protein [Paraburkholderia caribensis]PTB28643.1 aldehyde dehydrogenase family protein [Paraburkholderia caribensis]QLB66058.1 aldehyde dehydrogenase [Paraburkholderia caribensis]